VVNGPALVLVAAVEAPTEPAIREEDGLLEFAVPKIYLIQEFAVLDVHGDFYSTVLEIQSALYLFAGHPVHGLFFWASLAC
jgi:hypothetical protein